MMKNRHPCNIGNTYTETPEKAEEKFAGDADKVTERAALRRRAAIRIAAHLHVSYAEGVIIRDEALREAIEKTVRTRAKEDEVIWENIIPGKKDYESE